MYHIYNEDCSVVMNNYIEPSSVDVILTSPPYNTNRSTDNKEQRLKGMKYSEYRYDEYSDNMTNEEYIRSSVKWFTSFNKILKPNGVVLYNISYGNENPSLLWLLLGKLIENTNFMIADCIIWKKKSAFPNCENKNKLTRICEFVFVFCRKDEYMTFHCNKRVVSERPTGQKMYENLFNLVEAKNNDGACELNKATYSTELCEKLLKLYAKPNSVVYDPFMGTGTTAVACQNLGMTCIGSELSKAQIEFAEKRLKNGNNYKYINAINGGEAEELW